MIGSLAGAQGDSDQPLEEIWAVLPVQSRLLLHVRRNPSVRADLPGGCNYRSRCREILINTYDTAQPARRFGTMVDA